MASRNSSAVVFGGTIVETAVMILADNGNKPLSPKEIAEKGVEEGWLRVPRGRTRTYLSQLIQSSLYDNFAYAAKKFVSRPTSGKYKARKAALNQLG